MERSFQAAREVAIQERKDLEEMEDNFTAEGGFKGHRPESEIAAEIDAEIKQRLQCCTPQK